MSDCKQSWDDPKFDPVARKKDHEKKHGRDSQERKPREECPECGEEIYLKWGPIRIYPYWSHNRAIDTPGAPGACGWQPRIQYPESEEHIKGKQIACDLLNRGLLKIETRCSECGAHEIAGPQRMVYRTEVSDTRRGACRWDVAGLNALEEVVVGVEIKHSHETDQRLERRSHVWWAELSASDLLWHDDVEDDEGPVTVKNRRVGQICLADQRCRNVVDEKIRAKQKLIEEREERRRKRLEWAKKCGYIDKEGRFTDLTSIDPIKDEIKALSECIRCGHDIDHAQVTPFCFCCHREVMDYDRKVKIEPNGRLSGIFDGSNWTLPSANWRKSTRDFWASDMFWDKILREIKICARCQGRQKYKTFPYCETCYKNVRTISISEKNEKREAEKTTLAPPPPAKKIHRAEDDETPPHQKGQTLDPMSLFMGNRDYGPLLGITPTQRYLRAKRLGCPMVVEIVDFFEKLIREQQTKNT